MAHKKYVLRYQHKLSETGWTLRFATSEERMNKQRELIRTGKYRDFQKWED